MAEKDAADDDRGERALHFAARRRRERHPQKAERSDQSGHQDGAQAQLRGTLDGRALIEPPRFEMAAERDEHETIEDGDPEQGDEVNSRRAP